MTECLLRCSRAMQFLSGSMEFLSMHASFVTRDGHEVLLKRLKDYLKDY
jgi:hypothetical protein